MEIRRLVFFFFKQKTAYEMRISDWSSDVCSSDLTDLKGQLPVCSSLQKMRQSCLLPRKLPSDGDQLEPLLKKRFKALIYKGKMVEIGRASCRERVCQYV